MLLNIHLLKVSLNRCWTISFKHGNVVRVVSGVSSRDNHILLIRVDYTVCCAVTAILLL